MIISYANGVHNLQWIYIIKAFQHINKILEKNNYLYANDYFVSQTKFFLIGYDKVYCPMSITIIVEKNGLQKIIIENYLNIHYIV